MVKKSTKDKSPSTELIEHPGEEEEQIVDVGPYQCVGNFKDDFEALCREAKFVYIPRIIPRPHPPLANLSQTPSTEERSKSVRLNRKEMRSVASCRPESQLKSPLAGNAPKTFLISNSSDYFFPSIQVESSDPEKMDQVTEIYIKNWLLDEDMMMILYQCLSVQNKLTLLSLRRVGLNPRTLEHLSCLVHSTPSLKTLILDNNPIGSQDWHVLIKEQSPIQHLSLRYNRITPDGCHKLACVLSILSNRSASKLLSLNLSGNRVADDGADLLANGLKFNSSLLFLDLSNNCIGNYGTKKLAQAISKFPLSYDETVARRKFIWDALTRSTEDKGIEEVPSEDVGQDQKNRASLRTSKLNDPKATKDADKLRRSKKKDSTSENKGKPVKKTASDARRSKLQDSARDARQEQKEDNEMTGDIYGGLPNLAFTEFNHDEGLLYMRGNLSLLSLNLSYNPIDEKGLCHLLTALKAQADIASRSQDEGQNSAACKGLLRLQLNGNLACPTAEVVSQIESIMKDKHPFQTATPEPS